MTWWGKGYNSHITQKKTERIKKIMLYLFTTHINIR